MPCGNIQYHFGNKERVETGCSVAGSKIGHFLLECDKTADTAGKDNTYPVWVSIFTGDTGIFYCFIACNDRKLAVAVHFTGFLPVYINGGIEVFNFTGKLRLEFGYV